MSRTTKTKRIKCKYRLDASVCNKKQPGNKDKSRCEYKELIDKGICDKGFIWYPSNCVILWSCDLGEYYENCKCRKNIVDKLVEECCENIKGMKWFIMIIIMKMYAILVQYS